ncbi:MAG: ferritin family protein [Proteobacteria bacterium]|nr:ferritin family protein [Pseudomonadota bacterium]
MDKMKAIEIALQNELRERDFYLKQADKTQNPVGKKMFAAIAEDENEHYEQLKAIHQKLEANGTWPEEVSAVIQDTDVREVLQDLPKLADKNTETSSDDREAIKIAIDFEKNAYKFYIELQEKAVDAQEKSFFEHLAKIEWDHVKSLEDTLLFFEDPATWYEQKEKSQLDG